MSTACASIIGIERGRNHGVDRQMQRDVAVRGKRRGCVARVRDRRREASVPTWVPRAARNVFAMPPPTQKASTLFIKRVKTPTLSLTFAPPITQTYGCEGSSVRRASAESSACIKQSGSVWKQMRDALGRGVRAMRRTERVVDVEIAQTPRARARTPGSFCSSSGESARSRAARRRRHASLSTAARADRTDAIIGECNRRMPRRCASAAATGAANTFPGHPAVPRRGLEGRDGPGARGR